MADEVGPASRKADNSSGYQSRCSDRPSACEFHKGSGKCPLEAGYTTATVLRAAIRKDCRIYLLRDASIYELLGQFPAVIFW